MPIYINFSKKTNQSSYKTIYLKDTLIYEIQNLAYKNNTSFNNIIVKMIEYCLNESSNNQ